MAITSYATLKTAISDYAERPSGTAYYNQIDTFIDLTEAGFNRSLRTQQMEEEATVATNSSGVGTLPSDFLAPRMMYRVADPEHPLKWTTTAALRDMNPYRVAGVPEWAAVSGSTVQVEPIYEGNFTLQYFEKIPALDDATTTNWLLDLAPDAYLFACLAHGEAFMQHPQEAAAYSSQVGPILERLGLNDQVARFAAAPLRIRGVTP